jgi:hypothetical protein
MWWTEKPPVRRLSATSLIRSLSITAAAVIGLLGTHTPQFPFIVTGAIGIVGTVIFMLTVDEMHREPVLGCCFTPQLEK